MKRRHYVYLGGSLVAEHSQPLSGGGAATVTYQHTDALGTPVAITNSSRAVTERREYEPYGYQTTPAWQDGPNYTGHVADAATGLIYMQARYYDSMLGIFESVDPVGVNTQTAWNFCRYCYGANNPYKFTDPDGRIVNVVGEKMKELVEQTRQGSAIAAAQLKALEDSPNVHTIQQETRLGHQSNANNTGTGAFLTADGKPGSGSGSVVGVKLSTEKVQMADSPGGKVSNVAVSNSEKLVHELAHAVQMDSGTLHNPYGEDAQANRAANEDHAKGVEDSYREEQGLEGRRQWVEQ